MRPALAVLRMRRLHPRARVGAHASEVNVSGDRVVKPAFSGGCHHGG